VTLVTVPAAAEPALLTVLAAGGLTGWTAPAAALEVCWTAVPALLPAVVTTVPTVPLTCRITCCGEGEEARGGAAGAGVRPQAAQDDAAGAPLDPPPTVAEGAPERETETGVPIEEPGVDEPLDCPEPGRRAGTAAPGKAVAAAPRPAAPADAVENSTKRRPAGVAVAAAVGRGETTTSPGDG
jgi:hypothetical protein